MQRTVLPRPFCPSVRPSVKRVDCDKTKEMCAHILIPHETSFILVSDKKNDWWGQPLLPEIWDLEQHNSPYFALFHRIR